MSRSYKKTPVSKMKSKAGQDQANRKVRQWNKVQRQYYEEQDGARCGKHEVIPNGRQHRKVSNMYDVCEMRSYYSKEEWMGHVEARERLEEEGGRLWNWNSHLNENVWEKHYRRK